MKKIIILGYLILSAALTFSGGYYSNLSEEKCVELIKKYMQERHEAFTDEWDSYQEAIHELKIRISEINLEKQISSYIQGKNSNLTELFNLAMEFKNQKTPFFKESKIKSERKGIELLKTIVKDFISVKDYGYQLNENNVNILTSEDKEILGKSLNELGLVFYGLSNFIKAEYYLSAAASLGNEKAKRNLKTVKHMREEEEMRNKIK